MTLVSSGKASEDAGMEPTPVFQGIFRCERDHKEAGIGGKKETIFVPEETGGILWRSTAQGPISRDASRTRPTGFPTALEQRIHGAVLGRAGVNE